MADVRGELGYKRQISLLPRCPGCGGGHDQCQRLVVRVDDELSPFDHVAEVSDRLLDPEEFLVERGVLLLRRRKFPRKETQRSTVFLCKDSSDGDV